MDNKFNIHDWQAKQIKQRLAEQDPVSRGEGQKERLAKNIVNIFSGRLGNWYNDSPTNMVEVEKLFKRDREAIEKLVNRYVQITPPKLLRIINDENKLS